MFLVRVNRKTKDYNYIKISNKTPFNLHELGFGNFISNNFDVYVTNEKEDKLFERLEKEFNDN